MGRESLRYAEERHDVHKLNAVIMQAMGLTGDVAATQRLATGG